DVWHDEALESCTFMMAEMTAFFSPLIVVFYTDEYIWAILCVLRTAPETKHDNVSHNLSMTTSPVVPSQI
ncbi:hypothetical protein PENTCL1PPCAC_20333, partial [Pristionchus entomophagus]